MIKYQDLSEERKEQERQHYREYGLQYDWWAGVHDYAHDTAAKFGLDIDDIFFSGFCSQGDGASYTGCIKFKPCDASELPAEVQDIYETLHEIDSLIKILNSDECIYVDITRNGGSYYHELSMRFSWDEYAWDDAGGLDALIASKEREVYEALCNYARWIYSILEEEYEHLTSDETIDEQLHDTEYDDEQD